MSGSAGHEQGVKLYTGTVKVPGTEGAVGVSMGVDLDAPAVSVEFDEPVAGAQRWDGGSITVRRLQKYDEVHFLTTDLPVDGVALQWKANLSNVDGTVAGVVIARPNEMRITGEIGFILTRSGPAP